MADAAVIDRRSITSRQNALRSTGPRTLAGRGRSALNALRHGLTAARVLLPGEEQSEFDALKEEAIESFQPQNFLESLLVERIVLAAWRLRRAARAEREILEDRVHTNAVEAARLDIVRGAGNVLRELRAITDELPATAEIAAQDARLESAMNARATSNTAIGRALAHAGRDGALDAVERHERGIENALYKALHELERLQRGRWERVEPPVAVDLTVTSVEGADRCCCHDGIPSQPENRPDSDAEE